MTASRALRGTASMRLIVEQTSPLAMKCPHAQRAVAFLREIGLSVEISPGAKGFVNHISIVKGTLRVDPRCPVSRLLHESVRNCIALDRPIALPLTTVCIRLDQSRRRGDRQNTANSGPSRYPQTNDLVGSLRLANNAMATSTAISSSITDARCPLSTNAAANGPAACARSIGRAKTPILAP